MTQRMVSSTLRLLMAAGGFAAILTELANTMSLDRGAANFFSFFTIQSNIIGAIAVSTAALAGASAKRSVWLSRLRGAATLYMGTLTRFSTRGPTATYSSW